MTRSLMRYAGGRVVAALEGGYNVRATAECAAETVRVMLEGTTHELTGPPPPPSIPHSPFSLRLTVVGGAMGWPKSGQTRRLRLGRKPAIARNCVTRRPGRCWGLGCASHGVVGGGAVVGVGACRGSWLGACRGPWSVPQRSIPRGQGGTARHRMEKPRQRYETAFL